jgi:hypothetical protein
MNIEIFIDFLKEYVIQHKIYLKLEPPQASSFFVGDERITIDYPHLCLADITIDNWSMLLKAMLKDKPSSKGFIFWCIVENQDTNQDNVLLLIYDRTINELKTYTTDIFLSDYKEVNLEECLPQLVDNYSEEIVYH